MSNSKTRLKKKAQGQCRVSYQSRQEKLSHIAPGAALLWWTSTRRRSLKLFSSEIRSRFGQKPESWKVVKNKAMKEKNPQTKQPKNPHPTYEAITPLLLQKWAAAAVPCVLWLLQRSFLTCDLLTVFLPLWPPCPLQSCCRWVAWLLISIYFVT